ncbi:MAG: SPOR domain-containing protein [Piscirickettsiaceae bacterium]|nr:SPOR domain-containing protein [Piscirickettsiaceae bacterium]
MFLIHLNDNVPADSGSGTDKKIEIKSKGIEPTFDFYTLLPEMEVLVNKPKNNQKPIVTSPPKQQATPTKQADKISYMVQVGSFKKSSDADAFKAKLAFLGIESKVQTVTIDNKDTWHRVQIGPIIGRDKADSLQKNLKQNDIDSLLMRAKHS